jgi:hypothetical protein
VRARPSIPFDFHGTVSAVLARVDPLALRRDDGIGCRTFTMKQARRTLEQDIGLSRKYLDAKGWKELVASLVDKVRDDLEASIQRSYRVSMHTGYSESSCLTAVLTVALTTVQCTGAVRKRGRDRVDQ